MALEGVRENSKTQFAEAVDAFGLGVEGGLGAGSFGGLLLFSSGHCFQGAKVCSDIA